MTTSSAAVPTAPDTDALLTVDGVTVAYGQQVALRDVSLTVRRGSVTALLGPNGAGKTTLLRAVAGLQRPRSGRITFDGATITTRPVHARVRAGVCLVPEGRGVFRNLTVRENLLAQLPRSPRSRDIGPALEAFPDLAGRLSQAAGTMSGGQQQMLALARCYLSNPSVILLDEVSMGLAPLVVDQIFDSIGRLAAQGISLLLVEQYVDRALDLADHAYVLNRGEIAFAGAARDLSREALLADYLGVEV
ncbi:branched-chain amino acid transport system ATP-binding protein [Jatrophihabitans endophyticus]|uniref:Branched-chain amino acid transport system ATP-binding protein n=1 Tax=Jatrophihabitans endophyticus TaxID=1206085 RepID=A0A1M5PXD5_9ACTN|nr:ABC transporter ATP-binding protein [Jatrophihabitans endophyticus]SHH06478.1 branched-chain amino acid transport system ATP-binding protein [Jatrophihabitans endophyticus]